MDRRIFKKLAAMALTAAVIITNIGITSSSAQELPTLLESVTAPVVGGTVSFTDTFTYAFANNSWGENWTANYTAGQREYRSVVGYLKIDSSSARTGFTTDELNAFYFSSDKNGNVKLPYLSVTAAQANSQTNFTLSVSYDYDAYARYMGDNMTYKNNIGEPYIYQTAYLCYPSSDGTNKVVINTDNIMSTYSGESGKLSAYYSPWKYDLVNSKITEYYKDSQGAEHQRTVSGVRIPTVVSTYGDETYTVYDFNNNLSNDFIVFFSDVGSVNNKQVTVKIKDESNLKNYNFTAGSNRLFKVYSSYYGYVAAFYVVNSDGSTPVTPYTASESNSTVTNCFPSNFRPHLVQPGGLTSSYTIISADYRESNSSLQITNKTTLKMVASEGDDATQKVLDELTPDQLRKFYISGSVASTALADKVSGVQLVGYDKDTQELTFTYDATKYSGYSYGLWFPVKDTSASGGVTQRMCENDNFSSLYVPSSYLPEKWDLSKSKSHVMEFSSLADEFIVLNNSGELDDNFNINVENNGGKVKLTFTLKDNNNISNRLIQVRDNAVYRISVKYTSGPQPFTSFYIVNEPSEEDDSDVYKKCFPASFAPGVSIGSIPQYNRPYSDVFRSDYAAENPDNRATSLFSNNKSDVFLYANENDMATQEILSKLNNPKNQKLFYISTATTASEALAKKIDAFTVTGYERYDDTCGNLSITCNASLLNNETCENICLYKRERINNQYENVGTCYLWYPADDGKGGIVQKRIDTGLVVDITCPPIRWDLSKTSTITISGYYTKNISDSIQHFPILNGKKQEVSDFTAKRSDTDPKNVELTIKPTSDLLTRNITSEDDELYFVTDGGWLSNILGTFCIVTGPEPLMPDDDDDDDNGSSSQSTAKEVDGGLQMTAGQTVDLTFDNNTKMIMCGGKPVSPALTNLYEVNEDGSHTAVIKFTDSSQYKWVIEEFPENAKGLEVAGKSAKIQSNGKFNKSSVTDTDTICIGAAKANGKFNNAVLVKLVAKDYKAKSKVKITDGNSKSATFGGIALYITPTVPTVWTDVSSKLTKAGLTAAANENGYEQVYTMSIAVNKSVKLPFAPKDGSDRSMVYEIGSDSQGFSVINGTVKALAGNCTGDIICYPTSAKNKKIMVHVTTEDNVKSVRANTNKVTVYPNSSQTVYLGTVPPSFNAVYTVDGETSGDFTGGSCSISGNELTVIGTKDADKNSAAVLNVSTGGKTVKIAVSGASAPFNANSFKLTTKKCNTDGFIEVNIPVDTAYNLGIAMNPVTADADFDWKFSASKPDANGILTGEYDEIVENNEITVSGDVIKANAKGTFYMQAVSEAYNAELKHIRTPIYKINVYEPGSTVVMNPLPSNHETGAEEYTIVGGILMSQENADTVCDKYFIGGKSYIFPVPSTAGTVKEDIVWSCNKPSAVGIDTASKAGYIILTPLQTGTFTVTGKTKFTGQKISFKVMAKSADNAVSSVSASDYTMQYQKSDGTWEVLDNTVECALKEKFNVRAYCSKTGAVGTVKFKTSTTDKCSASGDGLITPKAEGTAKVGAEVTFTKSDKSTTKITIPDAEFTITAPMPIFKNVTVPKGIVKGDNGKFAAVIKNIKANQIKSVKWEYAETADASDWNVISSATALSGKFTVDIPAGTYYVHCNADNVVSDAQQMIVYASGQNIKSASTSYTFKEYSDDLALAANVDIAEGDTDAKLKKSQTTVLKKINASYKKIFADLKGSGEGQGTGYGKYYIPVFASPNSSSTILNKAGKNDIEWTSSNVNLANAQTLTSMPYGGLQGALPRYALANAYAVLMIDTSAAKAKKYTGKVTITGILKNSGKKITVTLNVNGASGDPESSQQTTVTPIASAENITPNDRDNPTELSISSVTVPDTGESYALFYDTALTEEVPATDIDINPVDTAGKIQVIPMNSSTQSVEYTVYLAKISADGTKTMVENGLIVLKVNANNNS